MFKRFTLDESVAGQSQVKSSLQRSIRAKILEQLPAIEPYLDDILPKKDKMVLAKVTGHVNVVCSSSAEPLFFNIRDGPYCPTLRLLAKYPLLLPRMCVDDGAIRHVMQGADVMVPGLKSTRAAMDDVPKKTVVGIYGGSKEHPLAVGLALMATSTIRTVDKGVGIETWHYLTDGLWKCPTLS